MTRSGRLPTTKRLTAGRLSTRFTIEIKLAGGLFHARRQGTFGLALSNICVPALVASLTYTRFARFRPC